MEAQAKPLQNIAGTSANAPQNACLNLLFFRWWFRLIRRENTASRPQILVAAWWQKEVF
jgi:hypothetical protein